MILTWDQVSKLSLEHRAYAIDKHNSFNKRQKVTVYLADPGLKFRKSYPKMEENKL